eukprot:128980_1
MCLGQNMSIFHDTVSSGAEGMPETWLHSKHYLGSALDVGIYMAFVASAQSAQCSELLASMADAYAGQIVSSLTADLLSFANRDVSDIASAHGYYRNSNISHSQRRLQQTAIADAERYLWAAKKKCADLLISETRQEIVVINKHAEKIVEVSGINEDIAQIIMSFLRGSDIALDFRAGTYSVWSGGAFSGGGIPAMYSVHVDFIGSVWDERSIIAETEMLNFIFPHLLDISQAWKNVYNEELHERRISLASFDFGGNGNWYFNFSVQQNFWRLIVDDAVVDVGLQKWDNKLEKLMEMFVYYNVLHEKRNFRGLKGIQIVVKNAKQSNHLFNFG